MSETTYRETADLTGRSLRGALAASRRRLLEDQVDLDRREQEMERRSDVPPHDLRMLEIEKQRLSDRAERLNRATEAAGYAD